MDNVNHPKHYTQHNGYECIEFARWLPFSLGNAFKYLWRHKDKNGVEDLRKAVWYLKDWLANPEDGKPLPDHVVDRWEKFFMYSKASCLRVMHAVLIYRESIKVEVAELDALIVNLSNQGDPTQPEPLGPLNGIGFAAHDCAVRHGWYESERSPLEIHALIHSEIAEATECVRNGEPARWHRGVSLIGDASTDNPKPEGEAVELSDALIRILDHASAMRWDMDAIVKEKMAYNETRPCRHGGKTK